MGTDLVAGVVAPDFSLPDHAGGTFTLSKHRGKPVVLFFYSENDTPICTAHACSMQQVHEELGGQGALVCGISHDVVESHAAFHTKHHLDFTLLADPEKRVFALYNAWGEKNSYGRVIQGLLRSSFIIDGDGTIRKVFRRLHTTVNAGQLIEAYRHIYSS